MSELEERLERLGLSQYLEAFVSEGFETWETVLDITESDLNALNVKLGHRRKLQRAIADTRGQSAVRPLPIVPHKAASGEATYRSDESAPEHTTRQAESSAASTVKATKRKYRRHPKPDEHAPERPPSAYVIFSSQVRESLRGQELSFTEIAKVVGERWQVLPTQDREACERQANVAKERYYAELAEYKRTSHYDAYQKYLEEFKAKHADPPKVDEGKRFKLETETGTSTRSSSHEQGDRPATRRVSSTQFDILMVGHYHSEASPSIGPARLPSAPLYSPNSTSPTAHPLSTVSSPRSGDNYFPVSSSKRPATLSRESTFDFQPNILGRDLRSQADPIQSSAYGHSYQPSPITPPISTFSSHYQAVPIDLPSRRSTREPTRLPALTHEDTTLSSESGEGYSGGPYPLPPYSASVDAQKSMRVLPQPVPSLGPSNSPFERYLPSVVPPQRHSDFPLSSLATLARVGELASAGQLPRIIDDDPIQEGSP